MRQSGFAATTPQAARQWQRAARERLFRLMMGGERPAAVAPAPQVLRSEADLSGAFTLQEITLQTLPDRRVHAWLALPAPGTRRVGGVLALHGHGGTGEQIVRGQKLYGYGRVLAEMGYAVIAPDIGTHDLQHTNWTLMGERTWDALACLDYLAGRPEVDAERLAVAGLSLGGETAMYVSALDERVRVACSSGWLTTVANLQQGHCPCWNFPGLEEHFDFADIFACVAPRPLVLEIGEQERAPGGFPVEVARGAFEELRRAYQVFGADARVALDVHPGGHVFRGVEFWGPLRRALGAAYPYETTEEGLAERGLSAREALRRGELARRCLARALGVFDGWWALRDAENSLYPRRVDQPVWAPQDNAADMLPFLFLTAHTVAPERLPELLVTLRNERTLTSRVGPLPDWWALTNRAFLYADTNLDRVIFNAAEYCKDGLVPMTELMGRGPWTERYVELMDGIWERAPIASDFGALPADDTEVNGDVLQALARLHGLTANPKYRAWAERLLEAYCFEVLPKAGGLPPHRWDFTEHRVVKDAFNLNDHGNEIIGGLAEWFVLLHHADPVRAERFHAPLASLFQRLLRDARNEDGLWYNLVKPSTGEVLNRATPDTWGYALAAALAFGTAAREPEIAGAARTALRSLDLPRYLEWDGADSYADSLEGALYLLNRVPSPTASRWIERMLPLFLARQQASGIVEGWYGDGNYARTCLLLAFYYTQGTVCRPWRKDLRWGAVREGDRLRVAIQADAPWSGTLGFDLPRHRLHVGLPVNYPRLNEFPEWYPVNPEGRYRVRGQGARGQHPGTALAAGLPVSVVPGKPVVLEVGP